MVPGLQTRSKDVKGLKPYQRYLRDMERIRRNTDGVYELAVSRLRDKGGPTWADSLCQADIISIVVEVTREYDRRA